MKDVKNLIKCILNSYFYGYTPKKSTKKYGKQRFLKRRFPQLFEKIIYTETAIYFKFLTEFLSIYTQGITVLYG